MLRNMTSHQAQGKGTEESTYFPRSHGFPACVLGHDSEQQAPLTTKARQPHDEAVHSAATDLANSRQSSFGALLSSAVN